VEYKTLDLKSENSISIIKITRSDKLNAVNEDLIWDLQNALAEIEDNSNTKVVILTGEGKGFCAGADLSERNASWESTKDALLRGYKPIFEKIVNLRPPVIASIRGPAAGIGAALALSCDLRVMTKDSYIMSVFSNIALVPDGGLSWLLPRFMGYAKAYEYAIEAKKIEAEECLKWGIANKLVDDENLENTTYDWAASLAKRSSQALQNTKKLMRNSLSESYFDTFNNEAEIQNKLVRSSQNIEAVTAFFEKREPNFKD
jgi:2-(1,2-epoxy-1,2-dihydrophenyl)acetyl-CoA isomerase